MNFKVNQRVIKIQTPSKNRKGIPGLSPKISADTVFVVKAVCYCSQCGSQKIDIGLQVPVMPKPPLIQCSCGVLYNSQGRWFLDAVNFRLVQYENVSAEIASEIQTIEEGSDIKIKETQTLII